MISSLALGLCLKLMLNSYSKAQMLNLKFGFIYLGVKTCEVFLCFVAIVRVRVYYVDFFVFFGLRH